MTSPTIEVAGFPVSPDHYINGQRVASSNRFALHSPIDQRLLGEVCEGGEPVVQAAIAAERVLGRLELRVTRQQFDAFGRRVFTGFVGREQRK